MLQTGTRRLWIKLSLRQRFSDSAALKKPVFQVQPHNQNKTHKKKQIYFFVAI